MENQHGTSAAAVSPGPFTVAYAAFDQARRAFIEAAPDAKQFELPDGAYELMSAASDAMDVMMEVPAPSTFELFLKVRAIAECPWPWNCTFSDYQDRLSADIAVLSQQFARIWLERWTGHGGSVIFDHHQGGRLSTFKPEFFLSTDAKALETRQKDAGRELSSEQRSWHQTYYDGQMNALSDMLDAVPGARQALLAIVQTNPAAGLPQTEEEAL